MQLFFYCFLVLKFRRNCLKKKTILFIEKWRKAKAKQERGVRQSSIEKIIEELSARDEVFEHENCKIKLPKQMVESLNFLVRDKRIRLKDILIESLKKYKGVGIEKVVSEWKKLDEKNAEIVEENGSENEVENEAKNDTNIDNVFR